MKKQNLTDETLALLSNKLLTMALASPTREIDPALASEAINESTQVRMDLKSFLLIIASRIEFYARKKAYPGPSAEDIDPTALSTITSFTLYHSKPIQLFLILLENAPGEPLPELDEKESL